MAKNFVQAGETLTVTAPANVSSGGIVIVGGIVGVAAYTALAGADVEVTTEGVFTLPKKAPGAIAQGAAAYWDATAGNVTTTATSNTLLGPCVMAAGTSDTTCRVKLIPH